MELINETTCCAAGMLRAAQGAERGVATIVAKMALGDGMQPPQPAAIAAMLEGAEAEGESDLVPLKKGADLFVKGTLRLTRPSPRTDLTIERNGRAVSAMAVFGSRTWRAGRPTESALFDEMPLTWRGAFGGIATLCALPMPHPYNPAGSGYVLDPEQAEGVRLPVFEDPASLIQSPLDAPTPTCMAPRPFYEASTDPDESAVLSYHVASPSSRVNALDPGDELALRSSEVATFKEWRVVVPKTELVAEVWLVGARTRRVALPMRADTLGFDLDLRRALLTLRATFTYSIVPGERRVVRVRAAHS